MAGIGNVVGELGNYARKKETITDRRTRGGLDRCLRRVHSSWVPASEYQLVMAYGRTGLMSDILVALPRLAVFSCAST